MYRWFAALLAASLSFPCGAFAQQTTPPATPPTSAPALSGAQRSSPDLTPPGTPATGQFDPAVRDLIRREVDKAREEMREEMRSELQAAQSARESLEATSAPEGRAKLDFLQLNGYLRVRGDLFDNLDLHRAPDPSGYLLYPKPLLAPDQHGTLTSANTRFRVEPTLNVSEQVRVLGQVDMLDNVVLGSTPEGLFTSSGVQFPVGTWTQVPPVAGLNADRNSVEVKRAWAEVQTPVGLLSFGRMPSSWGLGILSHAGAGIDDDYGDSVDRIQFALTPLNTPFGSLVLVPMYEIVATGVTSLDMYSAMRGIGQPFDRDQSDDARSIGLKIVRMDTDEETKRKLDRGEASYAFGAWYQYKSQSFAFPQWASSTTVLSTGSTNPAANDSVGQPVRRDASAHVVDVWARRLTKRLRLEAELTGIIGEIGNASNDFGSTIGPVLLRQYGGAAQAEYKLLDGKLSFGGEAGFASGDRNPGFGNQPGRTAAAAPGDIEGAQFRCDPVGTPGRVCDSVLDIRNFRFNPAYRVDLILWRELLQGVTDAWYLKPTVRYEILEGLAAQLAIVYSQAMYASSTPSTVHTPLGIEFDAGLSYQSDDGFIVWVNYGLLEPLAGLHSPPGTIGVADLTIAHAIRSGVAVKF